MAGGGFICDVPRPDHGGRLTAPVIITSIVAAFGGVIFGYDFWGFRVALRLWSRFSNPYSPTGRWPTPSGTNTAYMTAKSSRPSLRPCTSPGWPHHLSPAASPGSSSGHAVDVDFFLVGAAVGAAVDAAAAVNVEILIVGRLLLGVGIGFTSQATPVYRTDTAPTEWRGAFTSGFQFFMYVGVVVANFTNYGASHIPTWGWRLSLGLSAVPAAVIFLATLFISDTPSSLVQRGKLEDARAPLRRVRGPAADVDAELEGIERSVEESSKLEEGAFGRIVRRRYRPYLVMAVAIPMLQ